MDIFFIHAYIINILTGWGGSKMIITYVNFKLNTLKLFPIYFVLKNNDAIIIFSGDKTYLLFPSWKYVW